MDIERANHIQLSIWDALKSASNRPLETDFTQLLARVDESIDRLPVNDRLGAAGEAIRILSEIYGTRSAAILSEIDYLSHPQQEPMLPLNAFDLYVRQSSFVDLEQFIEAPQLPEYEREYNLTVVREQSKAEVLAAIAAADDGQIEPEVAYRTAISLAHAENVSEWGAVISARLEEERRAVSLLELQEAVEMPLVQVWLGLLLNGFEVEQRGEFYDTEQVWILR
jgi:hypothetical protein